MSYQTKNPILNGIETKIENNDYSYTTGLTASFSGIAAKTGILLLIILGISVFIWANFTQVAPILFPLIIISSIVGTISVFIAHMSNMKAFFTILYAVCEGVFLGTISFVFEFVQPGIIFSAISITFGIFIFLLVTYSTGIFKVGYKFRNMVYTMTFAAFFVLLFNMILGFFRINLFTGLPFQVIVGVSILMILLASFNLLIDFDNSKMAVDSKLPKKYEWDLSLGLLVSLVWLYVEVIRLLLILNERRK